MPTGNNGSCRSSEGSVVVMNELMHGVMHGAMRGVRAETKVESATVNNSEQHDELSHDKTSHDEGNHIQANTVGDNIVGDNAVGDSTVVDNTVVDNTVQLHQDEDAMSAPGQDANVTTIELNPTDDAFALGKTDHDDPENSLAHARSAFNQLGRTFFIGIGGAGMSVLAEMLHQEGVDVSGSDESESSKTKRLQSLGIPVHIGQKAENLRQAHTVVWSSAIKAENPEIVEAVRLHLHLVHRSDILALLMSRKRAVTVAGAHGKTTTSALLAHILTHAVAAPDNLGSPSYAIGGSVQGADGPIDGGHADKGSVFVAEADESDGSFLKYRPEIAIITNAEADHLDHYGTAEAYRQAFIAHAAHARRHVVISGDDEGAEEIIANLNAETARNTVIYTTSDDARFDSFTGAVVRIVAESEHRGSGEERFTILLPSHFEDATSDKQIRDDAQRRVTVALKIPGVHNARNATGAIIAAGLLGIDMQAAAQAAGSFLGAVRRFQVRGQVDGVTVVDDYAHHPTEIGALLDAARRRYPNATIHIIFQPHLFSRTQFFADAFARALRKADDVIVTGIFPARERQDDFPTIGANTIVKAAQRVSDTPVSDWISAQNDMYQAAQMIAMRAKPGDVVITAGAGDVNSLVPVILHVLDARHGHVETGSNTSRDSQAPAEH